jgi:23S rRNA A1618 N6-methylase RlmF
VIVDLCLSAIGDGITNTGIKCDLTKIRQEMNSHVEASQKRQKERYDKTRCNPIIYEEGDLVTS